MKHTVRKSFIFIMLAALFLFAACSKKKAVDSSKAEAGPQAAEQLELGKKYLAEEQYDEAVEALLKSIDFNDQYVDAYMLLGELYLDQERFEEAVNILKQGYKNTGDASLKELYSLSYERLAYQYYDNEEYDAAIEAFEAVVTLDKSNVDAYMTLYDIYIVLEDFENADMILEKGYAATKDEMLKETRFTNLSEMGQQFLDEEDYENAVYYLEKLREAGDKSPEILVSLSRAYSGMGEHEKAVALLESADNQDDEAIKNAMADESARLGSQQYDEGENEAAIVNLKRAIALAPNHLDAHTILLSVYMETGKAAEAKALVDQCLSKFMNAEAAASGESFENFLNVVSEFYGEQDNMEACLSFWEKAAALRPDNEDFRDQVMGYRSTVADNAYMLAEEMLMEGNVSGAMANYKKAFALAPDNFEECLVFTDNGTYGLNKDGSFRVGWYSDEDGERYYFNPAGGNDHGRSVMGWQNIDGSEYYFEDDGRMMRDDVAPDGRHVGADGKLLGDGQIPTEEETEESDEEETEEEPENTGAHKPETGKDPSASQETKPAPSTGSKSLKFNTDTLRDAKNRGGVVSVKAEDLFLNYKDGELSLNDIYTCMSQYGMKVQWISEEGPYELGMGDFVVWVFAETNRTDSTVVVKDANKYKETLRAKALPEGTDFAIEFGSTATRSNETVDIDKMETVNKK